MYRGVCLRCTPAAMQWIVWHTEPTGCDHCVLDMVMQFLDFFLKGNLSLEPHPRKKPHDWLPGQGWQDLMKLTELAAAKNQAGTAHTCSLTCIGACCRAIDSISQPNV